MKTKKQRKKDTCAKTSFNTWRHDHRKKEEVYTEA